MLKVGITGGIGSGKTTVCKLFATLGVPVFYADDAAKWLMEHDETLIAQLTATFGPDVYLPGNKLNRPLLASIVFNNAAALHQLESMVHPAVQMYSTNWMLKQTFPYILKEAALLFESGSYKHLDKIIVVYAPEIVRLKRVIYRDGSNEEAVKARMSKQMPDEEKVKKADYLIYNDGSQLLIPQVLHIHEQLLNEANQLKAE